jgi:hypothetical protein
MDERIKFFTGRSIDKLALIDRGELIYPPFLRPCRLKILMVVDGYPGSFLNVSFSHAYFGLSAVLDTLRENPEYFVKFDVTRAHRQTDTFKPDPIAEPLLHERYGPHYESFRFTQAGFDINLYDQVWLFGARSNPNDVDRLSNDELEILARWMDERQGGLFATGDHADLGASMCARVPRARTMRRWTIAQGVPQPVGTARHDTNLKGHNSTYTFDDESDDIPMRITPRLYSLASFSPFIRRRAPHPVLCGTDGVIDVLPDHPHEGWVYEDSEIDLSQAVNFNAYNAPEYPVTGGIQPRPEVIAHAHVLADHTNLSDTNKGAADAKTFGAIGAYSGHACNVGRVVVDSTWHHWFDVNLTGRPIGNLDSAPFDGSNPKTLGFLATPSGQAEFARIQNYFRNVAIWLASPPKQNCMFFRATWGGILRYPLIERLRVDLPLWELGGSARDAIGRRAGQCTLTQWIFDLLPIRIREMFEVRPIPDPNPCLTCPPFELLELYVMGGVTRELLKLAYSIEDSGKVEETAVARSFAAGMKSGMQELTHALHGSLARTRGFSDRLASLAGQLPSEKVFLEEQVRRSSRQSRSRPAAKVKRRKK